MLKLGNIEMRRNSEIVYIKEKVISVVYTKEIGNMNGNKNRYIKGVNKKY
jgi:hypothetical protein